MKKQINLFRVNTTAYGEEDFLIVTNLTDEQVKKVLEPFVLKFRNGDDNYDNDMLIGLIKTYEILLWILLVDSVNNRPASVLILFCPRLPYASPEPLTIFFVYCFGQTVYSVCVIQFHIKRVIDKAFEFFKLLWCPRKTINKSV